jgi:hypothetical protein
MRKSYKKITCWMRDVEKALENPVSILLPPVAQFSEEIFFRSKPE